MSRRYFIISRCVSARKKRGKEDLYLLRWELALLPAD